MIHHARRLAASESPTAGAVMVPRDTQLSCMYQMQVRRQLSFHANRVLAMGDSVDCAAIGRQIILDDIAMSRQRVCSQRGQRLRARLRSCLRSLVDVGKQIHVEPSGVGTRQCTLTSYSMHGIWTSFASRTLLHVPDTPTYKLPVSPCEAACTAHTNELTAWTPSVWRCGLLQMCKASCVHAVGLAQVRRACRLRCAPNTVKTFAPNCCSEEGAAAATVTLVVTIIVVVTVAGGPVAVAAHVLEACHAPPCPQYVSVSERPCCSAVPQCR